MIGSNYADEEADDTLTPKRIKLIQDSWKKAYALGAEKVGLLLFKRMFELDPE